MQCCECKISLIELSKRVFTCETCSSDPAAGDAVFWCRKCNDSTEHEHKRTKQRAPVAKEEKGDGDEGDEETQRYLDNLFEDYHNLDCEDVIAGGAIKTRFSY